MSRALNESTTCPQHQKTVHKQQQPLASNNTTPTIKCARTLAYAKLSDTTTIWLNTPPTNIPINTTTQSTYDQIWAFLTTLQLQDTTNEQHGTTWYELYILFHVRGGKLEYTDIKPLHATRTLLREALTTFKQFTKRVIQDCGNATNRAHFAPTTSTRPRFATLGARNHQPAINALIHVHTNEARDITRAIIGQRVHLTNNKNNYCRTLTSTFH